MITRYYDRYDVQPAIEKSRMLVKDILHEREELLSMALEDGDAPEVKYQEPEAKVESSDVDHEVK